MRIGIMLAVVLAVSVPATATDVEGAWRHVGRDGTVGTWIVTDEHFSVAWYSTDPAKFISAEGGSWSVAEGGMELTYEFDTASPERVGSVERLLIKNYSGGGLTADGRNWTRLDDGSPGALQGSWLMTGRVRDGETQTRKPGARRTMKILSGTRFQWIAYNVETKEFFGSGGGTYTTVDGRYTESIEFFSRDDSVAGRSLDFQYEIIDGAWHHEGKSSKGDPMHEIWNRRKEVGI